MMEVILITVILALSLLALMWFTIDLLDNKCGSKGILPKSYTTRTGVIHTAKKNRTEHIN